MEYELETRQSDLGRAASESKWKLALEVVKLDSGHVWVAVRGNSAGGHKLGFLVAVSTEAVTEQRPRRYRAGADGGAFEQLAVGSTVVACRPWEVDSRPTDGPLVQGCDSVEPPYYLLRTLSAKVTGSGFRGVFLSVRQQVTAAARGTEGAAGSKLPELPVLFPPRAWYRRIPVGASGSLEAEQHEEVVLDGRVAERSRPLGLVRRTSADLERKDLTELNGNFYAVDDRQWGSARLTDLGDVLSQIAFRVERPTSGVQRKMLTLPKGAVETVVEVDSAEYAVDPFSSVFDDLAWGGRAGPVRRSGPDGDQLCDWGAGPLPLASPASGPPEVLSRDELSGPLSAARDAIRCRPAPSSKQRPMSSSVFQLRITILPSGKPSKVTVAPHPAEWKGTKVPQDRAKCVEREVLKLRWPVHTRQMAVYEMPFAL